VPKVALSTGIEWGESLIGSLTLVVTSFNLGVGVRTETLGVDMVFRLWGSERRLILGVETLVKVV